MVMASANAAAAEIGAVTRLPGRSTRKYSPPAMARPKTMRSSTGGCVGASVARPAIAKTRLDRVSTRPTRPSSVSTPIARAGHFTTSARCRALGPRPFGHGVGLGRIVVVVAADQGRHALDVLPAGVPLLSDHAASEGRHHGRVELGPGSPLQLVKRVVNRQGVVVGVSGCQRLECVRDSHDAGEQRDLLSPLPQWVPPSVITLVMEANAVERRLEELDLLHHLRATSRMQPDAGEVRVAEGVGLAQDVARNSQDPDVVQHPGIAQGGGFGVVQTQAPGNEVTQPGNALTVSAGANVLGLHRRHKGAQRPVVGAVPRRTGRRPTGRRKEVDSTRRALKGPTPAGTQRTANRKPISP